MPEKKRSSGLHICVKKKDEKRKRYCVFNSASGHKIIHVAFRLSELHLVLVFFSFSLVYVVNSYELIFLLPSRNPCLLYVFFARKGNGPLSLSAFPTILTEVIFQNVKMTQDWKRFSRALVFDKNKWGYWNLLNQMHLFISQTIPRHIVRTKNESARRPEYK